MLKAVQANPSLAVPVIDHSDVGPINMVEGHRATRGQSRPQRGFALVAESVQEADDDFIKTAIPVEELRAALEDEDFSEETPTTEGSEPDPDPSPIEEWVMHEPSDGALHQYPVTPGWEPEPTKANEEQLEWTEQDEDYIPDTVGDTTESEEEPDSPDQQTGPRALLTLTLPPKERMG